MALGRVSEEGQVILPPDICAAAGVEPGDIITMRVTGPGTLEVRVLPRLTLANLLEWYRIEGPIDEAADREKWQDEAAKDVFGADD